MYYSTSSQSSYFTFCISHIISVVSPHIISVDHHIYICCVSHIFTISTMVCLPIITITYSQYWRRSSIWFPSYLQSIPCSEFGHPPSPRSSCSKLMQKSVLLYHSVNNITQILSMSAASVAHAYIIHLYHII